MLISWFGLTLPLVHGADSFRLFFFLKIRLAPRSILFPYTTLFRSARDYSRAFFTGSGGRRRPAEAASWEDRKSTRLNSSHANISYAVFCLKKKKNSWFALTLPLLNAVDLFR